MEHVPVIQIDGRVQQIFPGGAGTVRHQVDLKMTPQQKIKAEAVTEFAWFATLASQNVPGVGSAIHDN